MAMVLRPDVSSGGTSALPTNSASTTSVDPSYDVFLKYGGGFGGYNPYTSPSMAGKSPYSTYGNPGVDVSTVPTVDPNTVDADPTGLEQAQWEFDKQRELLAEQRAFNSAEAEKNREWQERMSNTAYQRATEDLEKAGLNKWLAITGGGNGASASTPSGSTATSSSGDASAPNPSLLKAIYQFSAAIATSVIRLFDFF